MKQFSLVLLVLVIGLNHWIIEPEIQLNDEGVILKPLRGQSKFKSASIHEPENSMLNNASWVDYPIDDNGDGLYDYLVIDNISLTSITQSMYLLGVLKSSNAQCLGIDETIISPSDNAISLSFHGQPINAIGSNGYYEVWVSLSTNSACQGFNLILMYITSQAYKANEFEEASAVIIGFVSDEGHDADGDNLFDEITLEVILQVQQEGYYHLRLILESNNIYAIETQNFTGDWEGYLNVGIETVMANVSTSKFYAAQLNGPYSVDMAYIAYREWWWQYPQNYLINAYTTGIYNYTEFDPPAAFLTGTYSDQGVDTDGDGKFNQLVIEVEINVTFAGFYYLYLEISSMKDNIPYGEGSGKDCDVGINILAVFFDVAVSTVYSRQLNTSYVIDQIKFLENGGEVYTPYTTRIYNYTEFDPPAAFLTGTYSDRGADTDGDGKFNQLAIEVEINVTFTGPYNLELELSSTKNDITFQEESGESFNVGIHTVVVFFNVSFLVYSHQENTSYVIDWVRLYGDGGEVYPAYTTRIYNYTEFDPPAVFLTGTYKDRGADTDGDGKFNQLVIEVVINVTFAGFYYLYLEISSTKDDISYSEGIGKHCNIGIHSMSVLLDVPVATVYSRQVNTSYVIDWVRLSTYQNFIGNVYPAYTTRIYNYTEFDPPAVVLTGTYSDRGADTDGDGKFNQLIIDVEISITLPGYYNLYLELSSKVGQNYDQELHQVYWDEGLRNVSIPFSIVFLDFVDQKSTSFVVDYICIMEYFSDNNLYWIYDAYETRVYNYTEYDAPPAFLTKNYYDHGVDLDADGRFDELVINIEINFTETGRYTVKIVLRDIYSGISFNEVNSSYWTEGMKNISVSIDTYLLYPSIPSLTKYVLESIDIYDSNNNLISQSYQNSTLNYYYTECDIHQIMIDGNNDFNFLIGDENWPGDGTPLNPYIIEGLTLNGPKTIDLISIRNTDVYFRLNNCSLNGAATGIFLDNVKNAYISNNLIQYNLEGIYLTFSGNNVITGNTINSNNNGIRLGSNKGDFPGSVNSNTIINNTLCNNFRIGVWTAFESGGNSVMWNDFINNGHVIDPPPKSQARDNGLNNTFSFNYWYNWTNNEPYPIIGYSGSYDSNPLANPHHLSKPTILFPNWGKTLRNTIVIDWIPAKDDLGHDITYSVYYSSDNGSIWIILGTELSITSFRWDVNNVSIGSAFLVKVIALDSFGFFTMDTSDQLFTIQAPPPPPSTFLFRLALLLLLCSFLFVVIQKKAK